MDYLRQVLCTLQAEKFYANLKECVFCTDRIVFLEFMVSSEGVSADCEKIRQLLSGHNPE